MIPFQWKMKIYKNKTRNEFIKHGVPVLWNVCTNTHTIPIRTLYFQTHLSMSVNLNDIPRHVYAMLIVWYYHCELI